MGLLKAVIADARPATARGMPPPATGKPLRESGAVMRSPGAAPDISASPQSGTMPAAPAAANRWSGGAVFRDDAVAAVSATAPGVSRLLPQPAGLPPATPLSTHARDLGTAGPQSAQARREAPPPPFRSRTARAVAPRSAASTAVDAGPVENSRPTASIGDTGAGRESLPAAVREASRTVVDESSPERSRTPQRPRAESAGLPASASASPPENDPSAAVGAGRFRGVDVDPGSATRPEPAENSGSQPAAAAVPRASAAPPPAGNGPAPPAAHENLPATPAAAERTAGAVRANGRAEAAHTRPRASAAQTHDPGLVPQAPPDAQPAPLASPRPQSGPGEPAAPAGEPVATAAERLTPPAVAEAGQPGAAQPPVADIPALEVLPEPPGQAALEVRPARNPLAEPLPRQDRQAPVMPAVIEVPQTPTVKIGQVDVFIQAPARSRGSTLPARPVPAPASRNYLRRL